MNRRCPALGLLIEGAGMIDRNAEGGTMTFPDLLQLLELFHERDYAQARPHLYFKSLKTDSWVRPKGMRILPSDLQIAILDAESEQWETIPFRDVNFGLW
jgi:hypothetical protein